MSGSTPNRVAKRYFQAVISKVEVKTELASVDTALKAAARWIAEYPQVLSAAEADAHATPGGLEPGEVWQDRFVAYWSEWDTIEETLRAIVDKLDGAYLDMNDSKLRENVGQVIGAIWSMTKYERTSKFKTSYAFQEPKFRTHPAHKPHHIAYEVKRLTEWAAHFKRWVETTASLTKAAQRSAAVYRPG